MLIRQNTNWQWFKIKRKKQKHFPNLNIKLMMRSYANIANRIAVHSKRLKTWSILIISQTFIYITSFSHRRRVHDWNHHISNQDQWELVAATVAPALKTMFIAGTGFGTCVNLLVPAPNRFAGTRPETMVGATTSVVATTSGATTCRVVTPVVCVGYVSDCCCNLNRKKNM